MDQICLRCARCSLSGKGAASARAHIVSRSFFSSGRVLGDQKPQDSGVAQSGRSLRDAMGSSDKRATQSLRPLIRRVSELEQSSAPRRAPSAPLIRRSAPQTSGQDRSQDSGPIVKRSPPLPGQGPRRSGPPGTGQVLNRTRVTGMAGRSPGPRPGGTLLRRLSPSQNQGRGQAGSGQRGQKAPDRRRRRTTNNEEDEYDEKDLEQQMNEYITKYVDRPANPTEPIAYNPKINLDDLRSDWPNTPLSTSGMTESVVQKIEWLARRLPHGYQSPEDIAERFLKGNLTRFESEEEKQTVLKLASELSKKTKMEAEEGSLHKHEAPRFRVVEDPAFTSVASKAGDKGHLLEKSVKGDYGQAQQQRYAFMQTAGKMLQNNETYGPLQTQKLLSRVQSLIPQTRSAAPQPAK